MFNQAIQAFIGAPPRERNWARAMSRPRRALFLPSPIGLGHVQCDLAIAHELRAIEPDLAIDCPRCRESSRQTFTPSIHRCARRDGGVDRRDGAGRDRTITALSAPPHRAPAGSTMTPAVGGATYRAWAESGGWAAGALGSSREPGPPVRRSAWPARASPGA